MKRLLNRHVNQFVLSTYGRSALCRSLVDAMRGWLVVVFTVLLFASVGCGRPPAVELHNLKLVSALRTAVSARNETWLAGVERAVEQRFGEGQMSAEERAHFQQLIQIARQGDWDAADRACFEFEQAQLSRRRSSS